MNVVDSESIRGIVRPFAALMDGPGSVLPNQSQFDQLQHFYAASSHPDFVLPDGYEPWRQDVDIERYTRLPFALAFGLHPNGVQMNPGAATETFNTYATQPQLAFIEGGPGIENRYRRNRAISVLSATIVNTAINPPYRLFPTRARIDEAITFSRDEELFSRRTAKAVRQAVTLVMGH